MTKTIELSNEELQDLLDAVSRCNSEVLDILFKAEYAKHVTPNQRAVLLQAVPRFNCLITKLTVALQENSDERPV